MIEGVGGDNVDLLSGNGFLVCGRERKGESTEYVSVALNTYKCMLHKFLHTLQKENIYRRFFNSLD